MAFNLGSMGFLTPFDFSLYQSEIVAVLQGKYCIIPRKRLLCKIFKNNEFVEGTN
jgi:NAD kinase